MAGERLHHCYDEDDSGKDNCAAYHDSPVAIQDMHLLS
jgi:hypothetical protein